MIPLVGVQKLPIPSVARAALPRASWTSGPPIGSTSSPPTGGRSTPFITRHATSRRAVSTACGGHLPEPELDRLSNILRSFNDQFGSIDWKDEDKIRKVITEEIPAKVAADRAYQNAMKNSDKQNARIEHDNALRRVIGDLLVDHTELFKQYSDNPDFRKWLAETIFAVTYSAPGSNPPPTSGGQVV